MKKRVQKIFWGILLILAAAVLILYGLGFGGEAYGIPLYKIILGIIIVSLVLSKVFFGQPVRERFKIFVYLSLLFMVFEKEIANWANLPDENIINNWILLIAAILIEIAIGFLAPKKSSKGHNNSFSASTQYFDVSKNNQFYVDNTFGATEVYFQNTEFADPNVPIELYIQNKCGAVEVHVPDNWNIENKLFAKLGAVEIRPNTGNYVHLTIKGESKMGAVEITSP